MKFPLKYDDLLLYYQIYTPNEYHFMKMIYNFYKEPLALNTKIKQLRFIMNDPYIRYYYL